MHILPSRGRPRELQRFFYVGEPEQPGIVVCDEDQRQFYTGIKLPDNWSWLWVPPRGGFVKASNAAFAAFPFEPWYSLCGDDSVGRTPHWDTILGVAAAPDKIVWPNDLILGHCTQPFVGGDLCRALGWFLEPTLGHLYCDTVWGDIQRVIGSGGYMPNIVFEHLHWTTGKSPRDRTTIERRTQGDKEAYEKIDLNSILEKLRCIPSVKTAASAAAA